MDYTRTMCPNVAAATAHFHDLLAGDWRAVEQRLLRETAERRISFLGRPVVRALRPLLLGARDAAEGARAAAQIGKAVNRLARQLKVDAPLRRQLRLDARQERRIAAEADPEPMMARIDGFMADEGTLRFLEYNPIPFGTVFGQLAAEIFADIPLMVAFQERFPVRFARTADRLAEALLREQTRRGRSGRRLPNIAVVMGAAGAARVAETEGAHMVELAMRAGAELRIVRPEAIVRRNGSLWADGFPIDGLSFGDNDELLRQFPEDHALWTALAQGEVWLFGALAATALHGNKGLFALMSDPEHAALFSPEERAAINRHVPWTRLVAPGPTRYLDERVDLLDLLRRERARFVLKPTTDFGGRGVVLGWEVDEASWDEALRVALGSPFVVQERVANRIETFPRVVEGELKLTPHRVDYNPYLWNGEACEGALCRISPGRLLNITAGDGSLVPVFTLEDA